MTTPAELYEPFHPRWARRVSTGLALLVVAAATGLVWAMAAIDAPLGAVDIVGVGALTALIVWFCFRQATVRAVPSRQGVVVRNLLITTELSWAQVVAVHFGDRPWAQLDLSDGDTLAVMGIQSSDGNYAREQARRLATLVALHEARGG